MSAERLESFARRLEDLREINRQTRATLEREYARLASLRNQRQRGLEMASTNPALQDLTPRELDVLKLIAEGCSTKEAAGRLSITFKTAACHRHRIMQKIGVHGTGALVRFAIANRVVTVPTNE